MANENMLCNLINSSHSTNRETAAEILFQTTALALAGQSLISEENVLIDEKQA